MKNRPTPDTFISEINIYKPFKMNNMDSFPNKKLSKGLSFYLVPRWPLYLQIVPAVGEKPNVPPKWLKFQLSDFGSSNVLPSLIFGQ